MSVVDVTTCLGTLRGGLRLVTTGIAIGDDERRLPPRPATAKRVNRRRCASSSPLARWKRSGLWRHGQRYRIDPEFHKRRERMPTSHPPPDAFRFVQVHQERAERRGRERVVSTEEASL